MRPLRIIMVLLQPPLPFTSAAARWSYVLVRGLAQRGHKLTVLAASKDPEAASASQQLFPAPVYDLRLFPPAQDGLWRRRWRQLFKPNSAAFGREFHQALRGLARQPYDIVHAETHWTGWAALAYAEKTLLHVHNLEAIDVAGADPVTKPTEKMIRRAVLRAERHLITRFKTISTVSDRLIEPVRGMNPDASVSTLPLALDVSLYPFCDHGSADGNTVSLIGSFFWAPTRIAATRLVNRLWPEIKRRVPGARLQLVGRDARRVMGAVASAADISIHEDVPDARPFFASTDVLLYAPAVGSGMKVKIMESFAYGTPVVTNHEGAEGLAIQDGVHAGLCDDDQGLIDRAVELLLDPERRRRYRHAARTLIENACDPNAAVERAERIYAQMLSRSAASSEPMSVPGDAMRAAQDHS